MDKSWLMSPQVIANVKRIRRRIHSEFGAELHLTDQDLYERLAHYASRSRDTLIVSLWDELQQRIAPPQVGPAKRVYRGQTTEEADNSANSNKPKAVNNSHRSNGRRVYRGQQNSLP